MKKLKIVAFAVLGFTTIVQAQSAHTWVSRDGDDSNPCSQSFPCKTFAGALAQTTAGGEIDAEDAGSFGTVTITTALTIDGKGPVASIMASGVNGIVVNAGVNDVVILRNLSINGLGSGLNGIRFLSGKALIIENCAIFGFTQNGVDISLAASGNAWVTNTSIQNLGGTGVAVTTSAGVVTAAIEKVRIELPNKGIEAGNHSRVTVNDSSVHNAGSIGYQADGDAIITINNSAANLSGSGVQTGPGSGTAWVSNTEVAFNTTGFNQIAGTINTFGNNRIHDNTSNGTLNTPQAEH